MPVGSAAGLAGRWRRLSQSRRTFLQCLAISGFSGIMVWAYGTLRGLVSYDGWGLTDLTLVWLLVIAVEAFALGLFAARRGANPFLAGWAGVTGGSIPFGILIHLVADAACAEAGGHVGRSFIFFGEGDWLPCPPAGVLVVLVAGGGYALAAGLTAGVVFPVVGGLVALGQALRSRRPRPGATDGLTNATTQDGRTGQTKGRAARRRLAAGLVVLIIAGAAVIVVPQRNGLQGSRPRPSAALIWCDAAQTTSPVTPGMPGQWALVAPMRCLPVVGSATLLRDGRVLVAGGSQIRDDKCGRVEGPSAPVCQFPTYAAAEVFDPATGAWTPTQSMHVSRSRFTATLLADGTVLVAGGGGLGTMADRVASAERFDPVTGRWTEVGSLLQTRAEHAAARLPDGRVLVMGDGEYDTEDSDAVLDDSTEILDIATQSWVAGPRMVAGHNHMTAITLRDGRVLATDGETSELFDPVAGTWTSVDGPHRGYGAPVVLHDGRVLFSGDEAIGEEAWFTAELFDPVSGEWDQVTTPADGLDCASSTARWPCGGHSSALLPDGRVLVVGGTAGGVPIFANHHAVATTAVFDPVARRWTRINAMWEARVAPAVFVLPRGQVLVIGGSDRGMPTAEVLTLPT